MAYELAEFQRGRSITTPDLEIDDNIVQIVQSNAAVVIQSAWRGHRVRARRRSQNKEVQDRAARKLQVRRTACRFSAVLPSWRDPWPLSIQPRSPGVLGHLRRHSTGDMPCASRSAAGSTLALLL